MDASRDLLKRLKAADESLSKERMSRAGSRRVARRISRELELRSGSQRMGWIPMLTFVAGAALVLLFLRWTTSDGLPSQSVQDQDPAMTVQVTGPACRSESNSTTTVWGACRLSTTGPSMTIDTIEASHLEVDGRVVHLRAGSALFDVDKVHGDPVRVAVPQGEIVVVGTRFRVIVKPDRSEVELYEGRLEFHDTAGRVTPILAGQHIAFGVPVASAPAPLQPVAAPPKPNPTPNLKPHSEPKPTAPALRAGRDRAAVKRTAPRKRASADQPSAEESDAGPVIAEAERLRRQGRYADAANILRKALERRWPTRTADVLSYELGRLLERRVRDKASACEHWARHLERFGNTRYRTRIERSLKTLACE